MVMTAIEAVNKNASSVRIPKYIIRGFPKIRKYVISRNIVHASTVIVPCIEGWIVQA